jgi:A-macroglobulin TED domain
MKPDPDPLQDPRFAAVLKQLKEISPSPTSDGFSDAVMNRIHRKADRSRTVFASLRWAAAAVILLLAVGLWVAEYRPKNTEHLPMQTLISYQNPDGSWSAHREGSSSRYDTDVTALAVLALIRAEPAMNDSTATRSIYAGISHLLRQQRANGSFVDSSPRVAFTSYLAGMAIQLAGTRPDAPSEWQQAALRMAPHLPRAVQMTKLNQELANPGTFPARWAEAGGPAAVAVLQVLQQNRL